MAPMSSLMFFTISHDAFGDHFLHAGHCGALPNGKEGLIWRKAYWSEGRRYRVKHVEFSIIPDPRRDVRAPIYLHAKSLHDRSDVNLTIPVGNMVVFDTIYFAQSIAMPHVEFSGTPDEWADRPIKW